MKLKISGMTCGHCVSHVKSALEGIGDVSEAGRLAGEPRGGGDAIGRSRRCGSDRGGRGGRVSGRDPLVSEH